ncbi:MAG: hypothetical protein ABEH86_04910 [Haloarcula sp.]
MSASTDPPPETELDESPEFELNCLYDDPEDPSELTIFSSDLQKSMTEWVTADRSTIIPLDRIR